MAAVGAPSRFGRSLKIANGDLVFSGRDLSMITDRDNLLQAVQVMIGTPFATDFFNVNYGFDFVNSLVRPQGIRMTKELIRLSVVKSLSLDDRIREIQEIVFSDEPRFFEINAGRNPDHIRSAARNRYWEATVVLQTVSQVEIAVQLEGPEM